VTRAEPLTPTRATQRAEPVKPVRTAPRRKEIARRRDVAAGGGRGQAGHEGFQVAVRLDWGWGRQATAPRAVGSRQGRRAAGEFLVACPRALGAGPCADC
jgi:hypothetical protein